MNIDVIIEEHYCTGKHSHITTALPWMVAGSTARFEIRAGYENVKYLGPEFSNVRVLQSNEISFLTACMHASSLLPN